MMHKVKISVGSNGRGSVQLDGVELFCTAVSFSASVEKATLVTVTLFADVDVEADVEAENLEKIVLCDCDVGMCTNRSNCRQKR